MRRLFSLKTMILILLAAGVGALVALAVNQRERLAGMSEGDIRAYLDEKLGGRMSEDQLRQIQDAVVSAVKGISTQFGDAEAGTAGDAVGDAVEAARDVVGEVADAAETASDES